MASRSFRLPLLLVATAGLVAAASQVPPAQPADWQVLFRDDFEDGDADGWALNVIESQARGWQVEKEGNNHVFVGRGDGEARLVEGPWGDFRLAAKVKVVGGWLDISSRNSYYAYYDVRLQRDSLALSRVRLNSEFTWLANVPASYAPDRWYSLAIVGIGANIKVYVDDVLKIDYTDPAPVLLGGVGLGMASGSEVRVDDVEVSGPAPSGPVWVRTGGPPGANPGEVRMRPDNPDVMYLADNFTGVSRSVDGGKTWFAFNRGIAMRAGLSGDDIPVHCLTIDPHNPNVIWIGTEGRPGIFKSVDGGETWVQKAWGIYESSWATFRGITVDPRSSDIVYAAASVADGGGVVYKTVDGGENWKAIWRGDNLARYIWIDPRNPDVVYVSTGHWFSAARNSDPSRNLPGGVGVIKSTDGGRTWQALNEANGLKNLYVGSLFMHPQNPDILLAGTGSLFWSKDQGVYLSTDAGRTWELTLASDGSGFITAVEFAVSDPRIAYAGSQAAFWRSQDGGRTWRLMSGGHPYDTYGPPGIHVGRPVNLQVDPRNPDRVFAHGEHGGIFLTEDGGRTWKVTGQGYTSARVRAIAVDPRDSRRVYAVGNNGVYRSDSGGEDWIGIDSAPMTGGPGYGVAVDPANPGRVLLADEDGGSLFRSVNGGMTWELIFRDPRVGGFAQGTQARHGLKTLVFAPSNPKVLYAGMRIGRDVIELGYRGPSFGVLKSTDGGETLREANDANTARQCIHDLAVDPRSDDIVYAGTLEGGVFRTLDGGRSWGPLNRGLPVLDVRALAIDPSNPFVLYAGLENGGLYKTVDAGANWLPASFGMAPEAAIRDILIDPTMPQVIYAADPRTGVYRSEDGSKSWVLINRGLRMRNVNALGLSSDGSTLYAATEGEGVFRLDLRPRAETAVAAVSAASFAKDGPLAPESIASLFGQGLAAATQQAGALPLPTSLGDVSVVVTDSTGMDRWAPLFFVSATQINCQIPLGTGTGLATLRVFQRSRVVARGQVRIEPVAPALFTANADGHGVALAVAVRVGADGAQTVLPVFECGAAPGSCVAKPIDLGGESEQVILLLFGTGIRGSAALPSVSIGGIGAEVLGAGPQGQYVGLDQVNVRLPRALMGRGDVDAILKADGKTANVVTVRIR
jgi:uncharacterized protein (TIGR03437 family)